MSLHHVGTAALVASFFAFLGQWSGTFQAVAAICAIVAYGVSAYKSFKKK